ncbi:SDR family oxidoreductase [Paludifilum halophilum]|uniref:NAD-dependent dehydratase n=1 Tax=Paludifilum halophilum TaxID=1642702 RepID=A0A235B5D2_9BACL|nr:SDR family oxidoreductase [Paludifilum halophilum]OYD07441.1 NAD-dependent dehydratase [Paludifilum halophilum]
MNILVIGANGQVGKQLVERLGHSEHQVRGMIREESQAADLEAFGAETVVADLEGDISHAVRGCDAIVFAAGSGAHTGPDKTELVDHLGAIRSIEEAEKQGVMRFVMLSALRAKEPEKGPEKLHHYLEAKKKADDRLAASHLDYTIVRPGRLSNEPGQGTVSASESLEFQPDPITRTDVAESLAEILDLKNTHRKGIDLLPGTTPIREALKKL